MSEARRSGLPWVLLALMIPILAFTLTLTVRNETFGEDAAFIVIAVLMMLGYAIIGALLASRAPRNPIGWLMMAIGLTFLLAALTDEYVTYTYVTAPGGLPFGRFAAWLTNWIFLGVLAPILLVVVLFPDGRVPSRRWRPLLIAIVALTVGAFVASILSPGPVDLENVRILNPTGVEALRAVLNLTMTVIGVGLLGIAFLSIWAPMARFRRATGEERQQLRWLVTVVAIGAVFFIGAILTGIGLGPNETRLANELFFWAFFLCLGIGLPAAIAVAVLRYRLYDLDIVIKKTVVFGILVVLLTVASLFVLLVLGGLLVGPVADEPTALVLAGVAIGLAMLPLWRLATRIGDRIVYGGRATPYEVMTEFSERMADTYSTEDVLPRMAAVLGAGTGAASVRIWLLVGRELRPAATWPDGPVPAPRSMRGRELPEFQGEDPFEVHHQGELLGAVTVAMPANDPMTPSKERLVQDLASQAGLVLRNVRLIEDLRASRQRLVAAEDAERRKIERNIHDGAQQQLVALSVKLRLAGQLADKDPAKTREMIEQLQTETTAALEDLRDLARGIYPPLLADKGLPGALEAQTQRSALPVTVESNGVGRYPPEVEATVYFCALEALQNIAKYAGASRATISLTRSDRILEFRVADDGVGFEPTTATQGTGLQGMADRLDAIGATLTVESQPGRGTTIVGRVPVRSTEASR